MKLQGLRKFTSGFYFFLILQRMKWCKGKGNLDLED